MTYDVVIVGGGAAGMMCAQAAGALGMQVLLIEHSKKLGEKIRISGGGRCNFTNIHCTHRNFLSQNPHFCKSALARFTPQDFTAMVEAHGISYHEKTLGQLFCDGKSTQIVAMLEGLCQRHGVDIRTQTSVASIDRTGAGFELVLSDDQVVSCARLVIATGGPSIPKMGATSWAYDVARQFGLRVIEPRAALVPLTWHVEDKARFGELSGISLDVEACAGAGQFREAMLFTHRGLSGPAILQVSSYWQAGDDVRVHLLPDTDVRDFQTRVRSGTYKRLGHLLEALFAKRLAQVLCDRLVIACGVSDETPLAEWSNDEIARVFACLSSFVFRPNGTEGYRTAEVTLGGVDTDCLSSRSMEAKAVQGLYFIGEAVDVTGHLGGHNFQWAWASAVACAEAL